MVYFLILISIITLDLSSKTIVRKRLPFGVKINVNNSRFSFWHTENKGIAYNMLEKTPKLVLSLTGCLIGITAFWFIHLVKRDESRGTKLGVAFLLGGALANFINRLKKGSVTDFLYVDWKKAPIFNFADVFVVLGGLLCFFTSLLSKKD